MANNTLRQVETLRKIVYQDIKQFCEEINRNFAVIQNSPLFKGVPGDPGTPGDTGLRGVRGSQFIFVDAVAFTEAFPNEIRTGSDVTFEYLNMKLDTFETKQQLLKVLGVTELVDNDVIVLTNSLMLSYNSTTNKVRNTNLAFNEQSNIITSIQEQIKQYVKEYVDSNETILSLKNIFYDFKSIGKQYGDNNNVYVSKSQTASGTSLGLCPVGSWDSANNIGVELNHKFFGYTTDEFGLENNGTIVFGSMQQYYNLFQNTITTSGEQTFTAEYVPTMNNIPAMVVLQDTTNAGIMFGYKNAGSFKRFGMLYKDAENNIVLKSDMGSNAISEYSKLLINNIRMQFDKEFINIGKVLFKNNFELSPTSHVGSPFIRTGVYTKSQNADTIEIGKSANGETVANSVTRNMSDKQYFEPYAGKVFVCDETGYVVKDYTIETQVIFEQYENELNSFPTEQIPTSDKHVVTSNYLGKILRKINSMCQYAIEHYWRKNQFNTGEIPNLNLSNDLTVGHNISSPAIRTDVDNKTITTGFGDGTWKHDNAAELVSLTKYKSNVLVTDENGLIVKTYQIEKTVIPEADQQGGAEINNMPDSENNVVTSSYLGWLAQKFNNHLRWLKNTYWSHSEFETGEIPLLKLQNIEITTNIKNPLFNVDVTKKTVTVGSGTSDLLHVKSETAKFEKYNSVVLVTDNDGNILKTYKIDPYSFNDMEVSGDNLIKKLPDDSRTNIATGYHTNRIVQKINNLITYLRNNYWKKTQFESWEIENLFVKKSLKAGESLSIGEETGTSLWVDTETSQTVIKTNKFETKSTNIIREFYANENSDSFVSVYDNTGKCLKTYALEKNIPDESLFTNMPANYQADIKKPDNSVIPQEETRIITSNYFKLLWETIVKIKERFANTFNRQETVDFMYDHMPVGSIVMWTPESAELLKLTYPNRNVSEILYTKSCLVTRKVKINETGVVGKTPIEVNVEIPFGWVPCFGQIERLDNGATFQTPDMFDKYLKCYANDVSDVGMTHHIIDTNQIPAHNHKFPATISGKIWSFPKHEHSFDLNAALKVELRVNENRRVGDNRRGQHSNRVVLGPVSATNNYDTPTSEFRMNPNYARIATNGTAKVGEYSFNDANASFKNMDSNYVQKNVSNGNPIPITPFAHTVIPIIKIRNVR